MNIKYNHSLKSYNTFGVDATASRFIEFESYETLKKAFDQLDTPNWYVLGGGSNTLFTKDYSGTILHPTNKKITLIEQNSTHSFIKADAGVEWDRFVEWCTQGNHFGAENLSHIPGTVGASAVQNVGAYGVEAKDIIDSVECYVVDQQKIQIIDNKSCEFAYRDSVFKHRLKGKVVVLSVIFKLSKTFTPTLNYGNLSEVIGNKPVTAKGVRKAVISIRKSKLPDPKEIGNGGSFFKNPIVSRQFFDNFIEHYPNAPYYDDPNGVKIPAGWLIEQCGWKGKSLGQAAVHHKQALVLVNLGGATAQEIVSLSRQIISDVKLKFDISITSEVVFVD